MNDIKQTIADNLVGYRKKAGLTQQQLAEKLNYSDKAVSKWERAEAIPDVVVLKTIADIYGIKVDDFFSEQVAEKKVGDNNAFPCGSALVGQLAVRGFGVFGRYNCHGGLVACR